MSMLIENDGVMMSFREFCLSEAIVPKQTSYGINANLNDQQTFEHSGYVLSIFEDNGMYYVAGLHRMTGEVVFGASSKKSFDLRDYTDNRTQTRNALSVFSKVLHVVSQIGQSINVSYMRFDSANPALGSVYDRMVKNTYFLQAINKLGYEYQGKFEGEHIFKRI